MQLLGRSAAPAQASRRGECTAGIGRHAAGLLPSRSQPPRRRCEAAAAKPPRLRGGSQEDNVHEAKLGPNVIASKADLKHVKWGPATVVRNDSQNLDGSVRVLHLSVADHVDLLYGRRVQGVPDAARWIENYTVPGQCVGVRPAAAAGAGADGAGGDAGAPPRRLYSIASSPYASRRDSAYVDASLIEVVVDRSASPEDAALADMGPGAQLEVTQVVGRGFAPLLDSYNGLTHALEEGRSLVLIGMGTRGMAALRSALNWQPVLAHASSHAVSAFYLAHSAGRAAFVTEWDSWREAGMRLRPLYTHPGATLDEQAVVAGAPPANGASAAASAAAAGELDHERCMELLQVALFMHEGGFEGTCGGSVGKASFVLAGLPGELASALAKALNAKGVAYDHILFAQADIF